MFFFGGVGCCEIMFTLVIFVSEKDGSKIFLKISYKLLLVVYLVSSFVCLFCMFAVCLFVSGFTIDLDIGRQFERGVVNPWRKVQQFEVGPEDVVIPRGHVDSLLRGRVRVFSTKRIKFNWLIAE